MARAFTLAILSDIHYASAAEQARGNDYETQGLPSARLRWLVRAYRHFIWLRHPFAHNHLVDAFVQRAAGSDYAIAVGDYTCDTAFVGVSDDAACQSARECLGKLRNQFGSAFRACIGDHDLGKFSFVGTRGGMRLASYLRLQQELGIEPFWKIDIERYAVIGVTSSLVALPAFEPDLLAAELPEWTRLREEHLSEIRSFFSTLDSDRRILLFCHDPTALPFLWREESVRKRLPQIEQTIIGHLHTNLILWKSRLLAGMPTVHFLGHSGKRLTSALREARHWKPFRVRLCPSLAGTELLKDGGFYTVTLQSDASRPAHFQWHGLGR
jgi:hypothetical protein